MEAPGELVDIGGRRLHGRRLGAGSPTVVLESGGGGGSSVQDWPVQREIAAFTRCVAYDRAGLGWSDPASETPTFAGMATDLDALLTALSEPAPYVLVGGSFGGLVVQAYSRLFPDKVAGMVLVDCCDDQKYFATMRTMRRFHEDELREAIAKAESGALRREAEPQVRRARRLDDDEKRAALHVLELSSHFEASLNELRVLDGDMPPQLAQNPPLGDKPLVVLSRGRPYEGPMSVWEEGWIDAQRRLAALSSNSAHIVAAAGHSIAVENPGLVAASVRAVVEAVRGETLDLDEVRNLAGPR